jgi:hypothetical protein
MNSRFGTNIAITAAVVIAMVGITIAAGFSLAAIVGTSHTALATKGEAVNHISPQGTQQVDV